MTDDEKDLAALKNNTRIYLNMLQNRPFPEDPVYEAELDRLDKEAATIIRRRCDRTLTPIIEAVDAAIAQAKKLLSSV